MKVSIKERRLKLWKMRQENEGYDVSKVKTLEDAEKFFKKKKPSRAKLEVKEEVKPEPEAGPKAEAEVSQGDLDE